MSESSDPKHETPYDFSDWQLVGEDALSHVETAAYEIAENALRQDSLETHDPEFGMLHESVENLVRSQLKVAFDDFGAGHWIINPDADAKLSWVPGRDLFCEDPPPVFIEIRPRGLVPLFLAELSLSIGEGQGEDWDATWQRTFHAVSEWRRAIQTTLRGLRAMREEQTKRALNYRPE